MSKKNNMEEDWMLIEKQNASNIQKLNKKSELNCMIVKIPAC